MLWLCSIEALAVQEAIEYLHWILKELVILNLLVRPSFINPTLSDSVVY